MKHIIKCGLGAVMSVVITLLVSAAGLCCYSGLLVIPTAATIGEGQYSYEYQTDGIIEGVNTETRLFNNQFGIGKRLEIGSDIDLDNSSPRIIGNAKYLAYSSTSGTFAVALGTSSLANHLKSTPYAVASLGIGATHIHLGTMRIDGSNRCIAGLDRQFGKLTLMGDYTSGGNGVSSVGFNYQVDSHFSVMAGMLFPHESGDTGFTVHFVWCTALKNMKTKR